MQHLPFAVCWLVISVFPAKKNDSEQRSGSPKGILLFNVAYVGGDLAAKGMVFFVDPPIFGESN